MEITPETVQKIAALARLDFNADEQREMAQDLGRIIHFVEKLNELDTEGVEPLIFMSPAQNVLRADEKSTEITQKDALKNSPQHDSDYFKAPKVLGNE